MAGKHSSSITPRTRSRLLLFLLSLLFYTISFFTSPSDSLPLLSSPNSNPSADYSFVASLEKFTYDLLTLFRNTYRETSNLTSNGSPVHRLIEQA
ncbi:hypothetical protein RHGRI_012695 [Rhododendron griersonianum]|uniref:Uncharacterized protein n=1 Tax=Rhododendron griersonianum TaxID=479676 RepID=A0AAV6KS53_9ERIC|nr:hypothetical protein RHGRI_012695 [Rhododendron griersonianum]